MTIQHLDEPSAAAPQLHERRREDALLQYDVEQFLYEEARLLDARLFHEWYDLIADDIHYWMPARANRTRRELDQENSRPEAYAHFDDDKASLGWRIRRLDTGMAWAEDPPSRTRHLVTNVRVAATAHPDEYAVTSNFLLYRNRLETEVDVFAGERQDVLRRTGAEVGFQIARRTIVLDQSVLLAKNLSVFF